MNKHIPDFDPFQMLSDRVRAALNIRKVLEPLEEEEAIYVKKE